MRSRLRSMGRGARSLTSSIAFLGRLPTRKGLLHLCVGVLGLFGAGFSFHLSTGDIVLVESVRPLREFVPPVEGFLVPPKPPDVVPGLKRAEEPPREPGGGPHWVPEELPGIEGTLHILSQEMNWAFGSASKLVIGGMVQRTEAQRLLAEYLREPGLQEYLRHATDVILVGTASCEGSVDEGRTLAHARLDVLQHAFNRKRPLRQDGGWLYLHTLNLGRYRRELLGSAQAEGAGPLATGDQRRIVMITLSPEVPGVIPEERLREALESKAGLEFRPSEYHDFILRREN